MFEQLFKRSDALARHRSRPLAEERRQFLGQLDALGHPLRAATPGQIDAALLQRVADGRYARRTVQVLACTLRAFFRYAQARAWCPGGLAEAIKGPRVFAQESLPRGP